MVPLRSLLPEVIGPVRADGSAYRSGLRKPSLLEHNWADRIAAAPHEGAARLVPPKPTQPFPLPQTLNEQNCE